MNIISYGCPVCNYKCAKSANLKKHFDTKKHKANEKAKTLVNSVPICQESSYIMSKPFVCAPCDFRCERRCDYERHLRTKRHTGFGSDFPLPKESNGFRNGTVPGTELLINIIRQNDELKTMLMEERQKLQDQNALYLEEHQKLQEQNAVLIEYCKEPRETKNNFNLNFFLNVECKDAVNMTDFIRDLEIQVEDVDNVGRLGFVEGISRIIMNGLKDLELHKRPIHCTDTKRDVMYVRDEDQWQKDENNTRIRQVIETVEQRNCKKLFTEMKTELTNMDESAEKYMRLLYEVNGGGSRDKNHDKIIKTLSRNLAIDRNRIEG